MKIIRVKSCEWCPYSDWMKCNLLDEAQCAVNGVRDNCPLEDAPDTEEER